MAHNGPIVERGPELEVLARAIADVVRGDGRAVALVGPAGIGKTLLLDQAIANAEREGCRVLAARPTLLERELAFGVVRQLLTAQATEPEQGVREERLADGGELALPALGLPPRGATNLEDPLRTALHGLHHLCLNLSCEGPIVLAVDDVQWADAPSVRFMAYLTRRLRGRPILVLTGLRTAEPDSPEEGLDELVSDEATTVIRPSELTEAGVGEIVRRTFAEADAEFVAGCLRASGAIPFHLGEIIRAAVQEGLPPTGGSVARIEELSTKDLRRLAVTQLEALGDEASRLAEAAALFPAGSELRHLAELSGLGADAARSAADGLRRGGVLAETEQLEFRHPIIRAAVHAQIPAARRAALHRQAATQLMREHAPAEGIVFQLLNAEPASDAESARILADAARAAIVAGAFHEAIAYANRALAEPPPPEQRAQALREIGVAEGHLGVPDSLDRLRAAADIAPTPRLRAEILRQLGWALLTAGRFVGVENVLEDARAGLGPEDRDLALEIDADLITAAQMAMLPADLIAARLNRWSEDELPGHTHGERCLLGVMAFETVRRNGSAAKARRLAQRGLPLGGAPVDLSVTLPLYLGVLALIYADAFDDAQRVLDEGTSRPQSPRAAAVYGVMRAALLVSLGELAAAIAVCQEVLENEGMHSQTTAPLALTWMAQAHALAGRPTEAEATLEQAGLLSAGPEEIPFEQPLHARALIHLQQNRPAEALADAQACGRKLAERGSYNPSVMAWRSTAALASSALGNDAEALRWAEEELTLARAFGAPRALGMALCTAGQVAPRGEQVSLLEQAVAALSESPARLHRATALITLGAALRRQGKRTDARGPISEGLELARTLGLEALAERAREELVAAGGRPRRLAQSGVEALTASERRVIRLAAEGRTNREIAHELVVTTKTVEMHLRNAYGKLEIATRRDIHGELQQTLRAL